MIAGDGRLPRLLGGGVRQDPNKMTDKICERWEDSRMPAVERVLKAIQSLIVSEKFRERKIAFSSYDAIRYPTSMVFNLPAPRPEDRCAIMRSKVSMRGRRKPNFTMVVTRPRPFADVVNFGLPARCLRVSPDTVRRPKRRSWLDLVGRVRLVYLTALVVQLIGGALGGYAARNVSKEVKLGSIGNTIVGALGGSVCGQRFVTLLGLSGTLQIVAALVTGAASGGLATILIGFLKSKTAI